MKCEYRDVSSLKALSGKSGPSGLHRMVKFSIFLIKTFNSSGRHQIETLEEDINSVVMGKPGLENREESILKDTSWHSWTVRNQFQGMESIVFRDENAQKKNSWIATLVEQMKPVVVGKDDFQFRDNSKVLAFFWNFWTDKILMQKKSLIWFANRVSQNSSRYETGIYQASSYGELRVSISRWNLKNSNIWNIGLSVFQCNLKNRQFFRGEWLHTKEALNWHSHRGNEACTYVRQLRMSLNIEKNYWKRFFFGIFGLSRFWCTEQNQQFVTLLFSFTSALFQMVLLVKELILVIAGG